MARSGRQRPPPTLIMFASLPPVTRALLLVNIGAFAAQSLFGDAMLEPLALWPLGPDFALWQVVTYAFLHGSVAHLFFNMFALFMFGGQLERFWGPRRFFVFYMASVLAAAGMQLLVTHWMNAQEPTIGASGGVFGLLLGFAMFFPRQRIVLLFPPIPMPAWLFVTLYGALELFLGFTGSQAGVAHFAHIGGMLGGWLTILSWRTRPAQ
jgi:membrane associated rhomboid family serine protease